jgi:hypothetical protein
MVDIPYSIMVSGNGTHMCMAVNGVQIGTDTDYVEPVGTLPTNMYIGSYWDTSAQCNGFIDDLRISSAARTVADTHTAYDNNVPLPVDEITTCKMNFDGNITGVTGKFSPTLPSGKISGISIDSSYVSSSGEINLAEQKSYPTSGTPTKVAMSGDGKRVYYGNSAGLSQVNINTGAIPVVSTTVPVDIETNQDGSKAAFKDAGNTLYLYNGSTSPQVDTSVYDFKMKNDGSLCYYKTSNSTIYSPGNTAGVTRQSVSYIDMAKQSGQVFFSVANSVYSLDAIPGGWKQNTLTAQSKTIDGLWTNSNGSMVFFKTVDGLFVFDVETKTQRKLNVVINNVIKAADSNKLILLDQDFKYQSYDLSSDVITDFRPSDASSVSFDSDSAGSKMAYVTSAGTLTISYINAVQSPERYLLSFDGKNSWLTYKNGTWTTVKTDAGPAEADFSTYGMTIDEVNALNEADFASLYADGREIQQFDVAVYFASIDPSITPSLKGIKVILNGGESESGEELLEKSLYTSKQQSFDTSKWRKIRKIYPIEIQPKEAETYYFIVKDGVYKSYQNSQWVDVNSSILSNIEANWIDSTNGQGITQVGMTAEELRAVPEAALASLLPATNLTVVYAMKVQDESTVGYSSLITTDFIENLFDATTLTLKIKYVDGTYEEYPSRTKLEVEDFMEWMNGRQFGRGSIFYRIKTVSGGVEVNDFINYFSIKTVSVNDSLPS